MYWPFHRPPTALPEGPPTVGALAFGAGFMSPGLGEGDAHAGVTQYARMGGNVIYLPRGQSGVAAVAALHELLQANAAPSDVVMLSSVSCKDILEFLASEESRFREAQRDKARESMHRAASLQGHLDLTGELDSLLHSRDQGTPTPPSPVDQLMGRHHLMVQAPFVSAILPAGTKCPTTLRQLLPLLPIVFPHWLSHRLATLQLDSLDVLVLEPPPVNLLPTKIPDAAYNIVGIDSDLTVKNDDYVRFVKAWFELFELEVQQAPGTTAANPAVVGAVPEGAEGPAPAPVPPAPAMGGRIRSYGLASVRMSLSPDPKVHGQPWRVELEPILQAAKDACAGVHEALCAQAVEAGVPPPPPPERPSHLSTLRVPLGLFTAYHLALPEADGRPSMLERARDAGIFVLGDRIWDDAEPTHAEWVRFADSTYTQSSNPELLRARLAEQINICCCLEYVYKLLESEYSASIAPGQLPNRLMEVSWGQCLALFRHEFSNHYQYEWNLHMQMLPAAQRVDKLLSALEKRFSRFGQFARQYPPAIQTMGQLKKEAVDHDAAVFADKVNARLALAMPPRTAAFYSLEEKTLLILLSCPGLPSLLTDKPGPAHKLVHRLVRLYSDEPNGTFARGAFATVVEEEQPASAAAAPASGAPAAAAAATEGDVPTVSGVLRRYLLTPSELRTVLEVLHMEVGPMIDPLIAKDDLRRQKPSYAS